MDLGCQSSFSISNQIHKMSNYFSLNLNFMKHNASTKKKQAILIQKNVWLLSCELVKSLSWELHFYKQNKAFKICCHWNFLLLDCDWIWIVNHIFAMDLDWIDNPKKIGLSNSLLSCNHSFFENFAVGQEESTIWSFCVFTKLL